MFHCPFNRATIARLACASLMVQMAAAEAPSTRNVEPIYHATHWTAEDGLPQMRISALAQTPDGYLWVGTWFGLARFDGVRFVVFNTANTPELRKEAITALAVDRTDGSLWIGTQAGLLRLKDRQFSHLADNPELSTSYVVDLVSSAAGGVWVWTDEATVFVRDRLVVARAPLKLTGEGIHSAWETEGGHLVLATDRQCLEVAQDGTTNKWQLPAGAPPHSWIAGVRAADNAPQVWLGTQHGLFHFAEGHWQQLQAFNSRWNPCDRFLADRAGFLWAACDQAGLFRCLASGAQPISLGDRGAEKSIQCLLQDREGYIWLGTQQGLYQLRPQLMRTYGVADGLPHGECWTVCEAPDEAIWVGTIRGGARIQDDCVQAVSEEPPRAGASMFVDRDQTIWLGDGDNGFIAWRPGSKTNRFWSASPPEGVTGVSPEAIYQSRSGRLWVGTGRGAAWFENGQPAVHWGERGLPTNSVRAIYETRDGTMWFGTWQAGAVHWTNADSHSAESQNSSQRYTTTDGLADDRVFVFHEDADGVLWIGTHNGLSRFKEGRFFTFRTEQGLLDNLINWLEEDDAGRLWFSCNRGIFRMDRADLNAVADGRKPRATAIVYGVADGMLTPETNGEHQPAGCKARDGRLWFPTTDGVVVIDPSTIEDSDLPPPAVIEQVMADQEVIYGDEVHSKLLSPESKAGSSRPANSQRSILNYQLAPGRARVLQFRYTASSFADPRRARFRYRLAHHDVDWRDETTERVAYYTDLRPGNYQFEVKAASARGAWNETPAVFAFSLAPKFSQTPWFPLSWTLAVLAVSGAIATWRLRWHQRAFLAEKNTALERERGRIARDLHDDLGASLTGLALELEAARRLGRAEDGQLAELADEARTIAHSLRELSWTTNPRCDNVGSLGVFLGELTERFCAAAELQCRLELPPADNTQPVPARLRHDLLVLVKESLANAAKHARARCLSLQVTAANGELRLVVQDDGAGFDSTRENSGSGLRNLRERMSHAGGSFVVSSTPASGTTITATVPLSEPREK